MDTNKNLKQAWQQLNSKLIKENFNMSHGGEDGPVQQSTPVDQAAHYYIKKMSGIQDEEQLVRSQYYEYLLDEVTEAMLETLHNFDAKIAQTFTKK